MKKHRRVIHSFWRLFLTDVKTTFWTSFTFGVLLALLLQYHLSEDEVLVETFGRPSIKFAPVAEKVDHFIPYSQWLRKIKRKRSFSVDPDVNRYTDRYNGSDKNEAAFLKTEISVSCLIFPDTELGALTVKRTWGKHCNQIHFFSSKISNSTVPIVKIPSMSSFHLMCQGFREILNETFSWLLITNEKTFAVPENLRYYVAPVDPREPYYLGHVMRFWNLEYNWGEAGIALSRGALERLMAKFPDSEACAEGGKHWKNGDWYLGKNLRDLGIEPRDTRDHLGRGRFNGYRMQQMLFPGGVSIFDKYWKDSLYLSEDGPHCCSGHAITFNGVPSYSKMHQLHYMFYQLRPFFAGGTIGNKAQKKPLPLSDDPAFTWEEKLKREKLQRWIDSQFITQEQEKELNKNSSRHNNTT